MNYQHLMPLPDTAIKCGRVAVLMGGASAEREVSLNSGICVLEALLDAGVDAFKLDVQENVLQQLQALKADRVFNVLHGRGGEDGQIQALLDIIGMPYVGSGVKASAVTMDKLMSKRLMRGCNINTPDFFEIKSVQDCDQVLQQMSLPLFVKPVNEGSSIGMSRVLTAQQLPAAYELAAQYGEVLAEQLIDGKEYTVSWIGESVLPPFRIETPNEFYDYDAKYQAEDTAYICPCGLTQNEEAELVEIVKKLIDVFDVRHWGRADFLRSGDGHFQLIDINTVPGMTSHSLVPMAAKQAGISFPQLVVKLLEMTFQEGQ
jgi:D-alanine-D-alanine ligase